MLAFWKDGAFQLDLADELLKACTITHGGQVLHGPTAQALAGGAAMNADTLLTYVYIFVLATFLGLEIIRRVSPLLHTPLMSLTNAISAIAVVGSIVVAGRAEDHRSPRSWAPSPSPPP